MADDSLIEEMRASISGDRERAEQRGSREPLARFGRAVRLAAEEAPLPDEVQQAALDTEPEPEVARRRVGWQRWLRRRRND